jgi:hypothetical protein
MELEMHILLEILHLAKVASINMPETGLRGTRFVDLFRKTVCAADGTSFYEHRTQFGECGSTHIRGHQQNPIVLKMP